MTVLHATEPATVHLSCHARMNALTTADVDRALFTDRGLAKQLAVRRTLFVFPRDLLPAAWERPAEPRRLTPPGSAGGFATSARRGPPGGRTETVQTGPGTASRLEGQAPGQAPGRRQDGQTRRVDQETPSPPTLNAKLRAMRNPAYLGPPQHTLPAAWVRASPGAAGRYPRLAGRDCPLPVTRPHPAQLVHPAGARGARLPRTRARPRGRAVSAGPARVISHA
nr:crosslink repair DNA glycosylase YcaQ family protein [Streptomyces carminius]